MEPFKKRLLDESLQLHIRIERLEEFTNDPKKFGKLDPAQQVLMMNQKYFMAGYANNLDTRIGMIVSSKEMEEYKKERGNAEHQA